MSSLYQSFGIRQEFVALSDEVLRQLKPVFEAIDRLAEQRQLQVIAAMQAAGVHESSFGGTTGYGYDDGGRRALEAVYAEVFGAEAALVRHQFSSGTHVLATCLKGILRPGDDLLIVSGAPYDTLRATLGLKHGDEVVDRGSLPDFGIGVRVLELLPDGSLDLAGIAGMLRENTRMVYLQKSVGYELRPALLNEAMGRVAALVHREKPDCTVMVDNCYGEFVEATEPCHHGIDLCAGSLIKNPGAGIAPTGGYIVGRKALVERCAEQMTAPGVGSHIGPSLGQTRLLMQGLYFAPGVVAASLKGAVHAAALMERLGYSSEPAPTAKRGDLVQKLHLGDPELLIAFCQAIQAAAPVDSQYAPIPAPMPGYDCDIIMASGSFIAGSSIELSADGPLRPPYAAFLQGGLTFTNSRLGVLLAVERMETIARERQASNH